MKGDIMASRVLMTIKTFTRTRTKTKAIAMLALSFAAAAGLLLIYRDNLMKKLPAASVKSSVPPPPVSSELSPVGRALQDIFSISIPESYSRLPAEVNCSNREDLVREQPRFFETGRRRGISSINGRTIDVFIRTPADDPEHNALADEGLLIIERMLPIYERWIAPYPCDYLYVNAFQDRAIGSPGYIIVAGENGVNSSSLLGHELTHSYFHSSMSYSWLAEGAAQFLPFLNEGEQLARGLITPRDLYGDYPEFDFTFDEFVRDQMSHWSDTRRTSLGISRNERICEYDGDYLRGAILGAALMQDAYLAMGREPFLQALQTLYVKYRLTGRPNQYYDIFRVFRYFTPSSAPASFVPDLQRRLCM